MTSGPGAHEGVGDRSEPRRRVRAGDRSIDGRGRLRAAPALLSYGFRPFFLGASIYAAVVLPVWLWMFNAGVEPAGPFAGTAWHVHELLFGYLAAVVGGFILTAVPNWTGRLPLSGTPLAMLFAAWVLGRIACSAISVPLLAMIVDLAYLTALSAAVWREIIAGSNWRNLPVATLLSIFTVAALLHHLEGFLPDLAGSSLRLALGVAILLITLIGGRIVPSFTRNWLVKQSKTNLPKPFGRFDQAVLLVVLVAVLAWNWMPHRPLAGLLLAFAGALLLLRLVRWRGLGTWREPIVFILHVGYLWLAAALVLIGWSILQPGLVPQSSGIHALTAGAIGTMTLAVMSRATLGHTGHAIRTDTATFAIYILVSVGAVLRVAAPFLPSAYLTLIVIGGLVWSGAFVVFVVRYGPLLLTPRVRE